MKKSLCNEGAEESLVRVTRNGMGQIIGILGPLRHMKCLLAKMVVTCLNLQLHVPVLCSFHALNLLSLIDLTVIRITIQAPQICDALMVSFRVIELLLRNFMLEETSLLNFLSLKTNLCTFSRRLGFPFPEFLPFAIIF